MPRRITDEKELLDFINHRPSKKKKMAITFIIIAVIAAIAIFIGVQIHKANEFSRQVEAADKALKDRNYSEAVSLYDKVIKEDNNKPEYYEGRGDAYAGMRKYYKAIADYHKALEFDESNVKLYKKGVRIGLKTGDNKNAMSFINAMKKNVDEKQGEELRKETFVYPAQRALRNRLNKLKKEANNNKDAYTMVMQSSKYFDIDNDGVKELIAEFGNSISREKNLKIYAYKRGKVKTMLDRNEYGVVSIKVYDNTRSMEIFIRGNGTEEHRYYLIGANKYKKKASSSRQSAAAGAYSDGQWTYYGNQEWNGLNKSSYDKLVKSMEKGKPRETNLN